MMPAASGVMPSRGPISRASHSATGAAPSAPTRTDRWRRWISSSASPEMPAIAEAQACVYPRESAASTITEDSAP